MTLKPSSLIAIASLVATGLAAPALAQERTARAYQTEVSGQYSLLRDVGHTGAAGVVLDFGREVKPNISVVGEIAFNHFSHFQETYRQVVGGVRYGMIKNRIRPFGQVLFGMQREFGVGGFNVQPGGGVNVRVTNTLDARVQVDAPLLNWSGRNYKQFRFSVGIGIPLGGK